ncbi:MAG: hypothetical protein LUO89_12150, partial [Methanothrix sp.]|nr:hypothetical protein [Methanothrix sp.]
NIELFSMHKTSAGEKRKAMKEEAKELARHAKATRKVAKVLPEAGQKARELDSQADELMAEAEALNRAARLEDLHIWQIEKVKTTKKGSRSYGYWMATWREGGKTRNVHLGSCRKMDAEVAIQKARKMKAEALGIKIL